MTTTSTHSNIPLEADWVERRLAITIEGKPVTGIARANWGAIEVAITSPIANLTRGRDGRGWCFAMLAHHRPQERFALGGEFTAKGVEAAEKLLTGMYLDWLVVSKQEAAVDKACRRTRQELEALGQEFAGRTRPLHEERTALRRMFKAGEFTQREYQQRLKEVDKQRDQLGCERREAERAAQARFSAWLESHCGRRVSLDDGEKLLAEVALVVEAVGA